MAWRCSGRTNAELVENLYRAQLITQPRVKEAMAKIDRAHYCPSPSSAYEDSPQSIGYAATISAPHMHASAAEALLPFLGAGSRVLDVGSGSGYLTAVLAELVGVEGTVVGLEHIKELRDMGVGNMRKSELGRTLLDKGNVQFVVGDGRKGWMEEGKQGWDAIHVGAAAVNLHKELVEQLKSPGRLFIPVEDDNTREQWIWIVDKDKRGEITKERREGVRYVPLTDAP